ELVADATAGLEREPGLVDFLQDPVHRVLDGPGHGAVDRAGGGLVLQRAGIGGDAASGNGPAAQRPQEPLVPVLALGFVRLGVGQGARHALPGAIDVGVDGLALLGLEAVLLVPDVQRCGLERNLHGLFLLLDRLQANGTHSALSPDFAGPAIPGAGSRLIRHPVSRTAMPRRRAPWSGSQGLVNVFPVTPDMLQGRALHALGAVGQTPITWVALIPETPRCSVERLSTLRPALG